MDSAPAGERAAHLELAVRGVEELLVREVHVAVAAVEEPGAVPRMK